MHTEHLQNVRAAHVIAGWLVAIAVTSLAVLVFEAAGIAQASDLMNALATGIAVIAGFGVGGVFAGFRSMRAPILHGAGIGIVSVAAWAIVNVAGAILPQIVYGGISPAVLAGLMLVQLVAAVIGALLGYNLALRGKPGLTENVE